MQVCDPLLRGRRLLHRRGIGYGVIVPTSSGAVIGTCPRDLATCENTADSPGFVPPAGFGIHQIGPVIVGASRSRYEHHRRRTDSAALEIYLAAPSDVYQPPELLASVAATTIAWNVLTKVTTRKKKHARKEIAVLIVRHRQLLSSAIGFELFRSRTYSRRNS